MTKQTNTLIGKLQIVGAEKFNHETESWQKSENYVKGMCWEFTPKYLNPRDVIGTITETTPEGDPVQMSYRYNADKRLLEVEIFTDVTPGTYTDPPPKKNRGRVSSF